MRHAEANGRDGSETHAVLLASTDWRDSEGTREWTHKESLFGGHSLIPNTNYLSVHFVLKASQGYPRLEEGRSEGGREHLGCEGAGRIGLSC